MRAKEFIKEGWSGKSHGKPGKVRSRQAAAMPGVFVQRELRNTDTYMQYRYGIAVAAARANRDHGVPFEQESAWAENLAQVMYAPEDEETIMLASKLMGVTPSRITDNASREPDSTNISSPVAKTKRNKYGV
jgi:hypothetical protein